MQFWQQHAIITGGSSGIGLATAKQLARQGANISIIARTPARLEAAKTEIECARISPAEQQVLTIAADVSDRSQAAEAISTAIQQIGPPDILLTCAGMAQSGYFSELALELFEQSMAVNYFGALYSVKAALPYMAARRQGQMVLVSSGAGLIGLFGYTPYSPTKFAVRGLAESLRGELKPLGIGVSIVYPPDTDTPQLQAENRTKPAETKLMTGTAKMFSADQVAQAIVRGIEKKSWLITPGWEMNLLARWHSLLLPGLNWYFDRLVAQTQLSRGKR